MPKAIEPDYTLGQRIKRALGLGPKDINLPLSGAVPDARRRAETEKYEAQRKAQQPAPAVKPRPSMNPLKRLGDAIETGGASERTTEGYSYDFRQRNNLKRGGR